MCFVLSNAVPQRARHGTGPVDYDVLLNDMQKITAVAECDVIHVLLGQIGKICQ